MLRIPNKKKGHFSKKKTYTRFVNSGSIWADVYHFKGTLKVGGNLPLKYCISGVIT